MATIARIRAAWSGQVTGPAASTFYCLPAHVDSVTAGIRTFFNSIIGNLPSTTNIQVDGSGDTIDDLTGTINGAWAATATPAVVTGGVSGAYARPAGLVVNWNTSLIVNGRRLRGRTFVVPVGSGGLQTDGTIATTYLGTVTTAAGVLAGAAEPIRIWHRPVGGTNGLSEAVDSATVPDK